MVEGSGDNAAWPKNVPGRPTQLAVFGVERHAGGLRYEMTFTGRFPDLDKAMYWGAKKEVEVMRRHRFEMASRVIWQHELTPEAAVAEMYAQMEPQLLRALVAGDVGFDVGSALFDDPTGPMKPIDYSKVDQVYLAVDGPDGPVAEGMVGRPKDHVPNDPRRP